MTKYSILFCTIGLFLLGCKLDQEEKLPAYIHVPSVEVNTQANQGVNSENITEVWVYANNNLLGAFSLPATVPILESGLTSIEIFPGIRDNGINSTPELYSLLETIKLDLDLVETQVDTIRPNFSYKSICEFVLVESFELGHVFTFDQDENLATNLVATDREAQAGLRSGWINLTQDESFIQVANDLKFNDIPTNGAPVYLELDYKNDIEFSVGLIGNDPSIGSAAQVIVTLREQENWNKVYINLTEQLQLSQLESYQILFQANLTSDGPEEGNIFLDNVKLIHL